MKFNFPLTFNIIYVNRDFLRIILFWNYVPFMVYILLLISQYSIGGEIVAAMFVLMATVLNILNQLYIWSYSFFTAQDVSMGSIGVSPYDLGELFRDWGIKFKLVLIRAGYYLPGVLFIVLTVVNNINSIELSSLGSVDELAMLISNVFLPIFSLGFYYLIVENVFLVGALYQYSYNNSVLAAFNLIEVSKFIFKNFFALVSLFLLNLGFYVVSLIGLFILTPILIIPILGIIVLSIFNGFFISWQTILIPSLIGQIWRNHETFEG